MSNIFTRLGFTDAEVDELVQRATAEYAIGAEIQVPSAKQYQAKLNKAKHAARKLQKALDDLPDTVVAAIRNATLEDGETPAYPPGGDPFTQLRDGATNLSTFRLTVNAYNLTQAQDALVNGVRIGVRLRGTPLIKPQRRDFALNRFIATVAAAYSAKTSKPPTFSTDAEADTPERSGPFADLLRAVAARSELRLDPDTLIRKAGHLREQGSI